MPAATLFPMEDNGGGTWTDEAGGTTLWSAIDESGAGDDAYIRSAVLSNGTDAFNVGLTNTPADFFEWDTLTVEVRHSRGTVEGGSPGDGNDNWELECVVRAATFPFEILAANSDLFSDGAIISTTTSGYATRTDTITFNFFRAGTKERWDGGAELIVTATQSRVGGSDNHRVWIDFIRIAGAYFTQPFIVDNALEADIAQEVEFGPTPQPEFLVELATEQDQAFDIQLGDPQPWTDDWTGTDFDPWDITKWVTSTVSGAIEIRSNEGYMAFNNAFPAYARAYGLHDPYVDVELLVKLNVGAGSNHFFMAALRASGDWNDTAEAWNQYLNPNDGYTVEGASALTTEGSIYKHINGVSTKLGASFNWDQIKSGVSWLRFRVEGDQIKVRVWTDGTTEPSTWTAERTDSSISAAGVVQLNYRRNNQANSMTVDDLVLTPIVPISEPEFAVDLAQESDVAAEIVFGPVQEFAIEQAVESDSAFDVVFGPEVESAFTGWGIPI